MNWIEAGGFELTKTSGFTQPFTAARNAASTRHLFPGKPGGLPIPPKASTVRLCGHRVAVVFCPGTPENP